MCLLAIPWTPAGGTETLDHLVQRTQRGDRVFSHAATGYALDGPARGAGTNRALDSNDVVKGDKAQCGLFGGASRHTVTITADPRCVFIREQDNLLTLPTA